MGTAPKAPKGSEAPTLAVKIGDVVLDRYKIVEQIASGGHSVVFLGTDERLSRPVCIKVFSGLGGNSGVGRTSYEHFVQEAFALSRLTHPNTLRIYDFGHLGPRDAEGMPLQVCEYMNGGTLSQIIREQGKQSLAETVRIVQAMCLALGEAHALGIVHRDIKPQNILFGAVGVNKLPKLADFGIAKWSADDDKKQQRAEDTQIVAGQKLAMYSPSWAAPEQLAGQPVSAVTDIYSLACVAVYMLSGRAIFADEDVYAGYKKRRHSEELVEAALAPLGVPAAAIRVLAKALAFDPKKRLVRVEDLATDLANALEPETAKQPSLPRQPSASVPPPPAPAHAQPGPAPAPPAPSSQAAAPSGHPASTPPPYASAPSGHPASTPPTYGSAPSGHPPSTPPPYASAPSGHPASTPPPYASAPSGHPASTPPPYASTPAHGQPQARSSRAPSAPPNHLATTAQMPNQVPDATPPPSYPTLASLTGTMHGAGTADTHAPELVAPPPPPPTPSSVVAPLPAPPGPAPGQPGSWAPPQVVQPWMSGGAAPQGLPRRLLLADFPQAVGDRRVHYIHAMNNVADLQGGPQTKVRVTFLSGPGGTRVLHLKGMTCFVAHLGGRPSPAVQVDKASDIALVTPRAQEIGHIRVGTGTAGLGQTVYSLGAEAVAVSADDCMDAILFDFGPGSDAYFVYTRGRPIPKSRRG
jgi:serine/threonine-protein kinase